MHTERGRALLADAHSAHDSAHGSAAEPVSPLGRVSQSRVDWLSLGLAALVAAFLLVTPLPGLEVYGAWGIGMVPTTGLALVAGTVVVVGVVVSARWPVAATAAMLAPNVLVLWTGWFVWGWLLGLMAATVAVTYRRGWRWGLLPAAAATGVAANYCSTSAVAMLPIGPVTSGHESGYGLVTFALYVFWIAAVLVTTAGARALLRAGDQQRMATRERAEASAVATLAAERARMAHDLHDVVAHHISLIAVRAESAPFQHDLDEPTRALLNDIGDDARAALAELRHALAVLRRTDGDPPATRPQPTAAEVDALIEQARAAGQQIDVAGDWGDVAAAPGYVLYRAAQEGLTNARRHAPGAKVSLVRTATDAVVILAITNPTDAPDGPLQPGRGLLGMAERVTTLGGTLQAEVLDGVATLVVTLPVGGGQE